jgi:hypothetical protein
MGDRVRPARLVRSLAVVAVISAALAMTGTGGAQAATGYGPPAPHVPVPGGYFRICTSRTIGVNGGVIGPLPCGRLWVTLVIPHGAFPGRLQVTLTAPDLLAIGSAGVPYYHAVGGVGINISRHGRTYRGFFAKLLRLRMFSCRINYSSIVVAWYGTHWVRWKQAHVRQCVATLGFDMGDPDFAVLSPGLFPWLGHRGHGHAHLSGPGRADGATRESRGSPAAAALARYPSVTLRQWRREVRAQARAMRAGAVTGQAGRAARAGDGAARAAVLTGDTTGSHRPLLAEGLAGAGLAVAVAAGLVYARRRRAATHRPGVSGR